MYCTDRIIIFGTPKMLSILRDSESWFADGTFKFVPQQFYQLYTIHAEKDGRIFPCVYTLVTANQSPGRLVPLCKVLIILSDISSRK